MGSDPFDGLMEKLPANLSLMISVFIGKKEWVLHP